MPPAVHCDRKVNSPANEGFAVTMVHKSLAVVNKLAEGGISVEVVDLRSISPMDEEEILRSVEKINYLVVVRKHGLTAVVSILPGFTQYCRGK